MYGPVQNYLRLHASVHISTQADRQFVHEARAKNVQRRLSLLDKALRPCSFGACVAGIIVTEKRRRLSQLQTCYTYVNFGKGRTAVRTCALHQSSDGNILYIWLSFTWCFFVRGAGRLHLHEAFARSPIPRFVSVQVFQTRTGGGCRAKISPQRLVTEHIVEKASGFYGHEAVSLHVKADWLMPAMGGCGWPRQRGLPLLLRLSSLDCRPKRLSQFSVRRGGTRFG